MRIHFMYTYSLLFSLVIGTNLLSSHVSYCTDLVVLFIVLF